MFHHPGVAKPEWEALCGLKLITGSTPIIHIALYSLIRLPHAWTINEPHLPYKTGLDVTQSHPLCRTHACASLTWGKFWKELFAGCKLVPWCSHSRSVSFLSSYIVIRKYVWPTGCSTHGWSPHTAWPVMAQSLLELFSEYRSIKNLSIQLLHHDQQIQLLRWHSRLYLYYIASHGKFRLQLNRIQKESILICIVK